MKKVSIQKSKKTRAQGMWELREKAKSIPGKMPCLLPIAHCPLSIADISITHLIEPNMLELYPQ